jgi:predicted ribosome quality control (RQC) complex YloA/Tae2 family protein
VIRECRDALVGGRIDKIYHPHPDEILFKIKKGRESYLLLASAEKSFERCHLLLRESAAERTADNVAMEMRRLVKGGRIESMDAVPGDRIVRMAVSVRADEDVQKYEIIVELLPGRGNIIIAGPDGKIRSLLKGRKFRDRILGRGEEYVLPEAPSGSGGKAPLGLKKGAGEFPLNAAVEEYFHGAVAEAHEQALHSELRRALGRYEKRLRAKEKKLRDSLKETERAGEFRELGELLKGCLHLMKRGMSEVEVPDYSAGEGKTRIVPLNVKKTPRENVEFFFKKYRKLERGAGRIADELERLETDLAEHKAACKELDGLEGEDALLGFRKRYAWLVPKRKAKGPSHAQPSGPRKFVSSDGFVILMGRDDRENDVLTIRTAAGNDVFLHAGGFPGSHVIIRHVKGKDIPLRTLMEAAQIAAHYSKAKGRAKVEISYTPRKYVSKPRGAKPGLVMLSCRKTLLIKPDPGAVRELKERAERMAAGDEA